MKEQGEDGEERRLDGKSTKGLETGRRFWKKDGGEVSVENGRSAGKART